jgi:hypothetical protein
MVIEAVPTSVMVLTSFFDEPMINHDKNDICAFGHKFGVPNNKARTILPITF